MDLADEQSEWGNLDEAISLYHRVLFFDSLINYSYEACKNLASCYILKKDFVKAREFSRIAGNLSPTDSMSNEMIFQVAYLHLLENDFNYALIDLYGIRDLNSDYFRNKKNFYLGIAFFQQTDYQKSYGYFAGCLDSTDSRSLKALKNVFDEVAHLEKRYQPKTARILSIILPGAGQLYCGEYKAAINSFLLTAGLALLAVNTAINYTFVDAAVSVLPWFQRYYQGGFENAGKATIIKKERKIKEQYQHVLSVIEQSKS